MSFQPFSIIEPTNPSPLVVDSPHSGRVYPDDFNHVCSLKMLQQTEDSYVDELVTCATQAGATVITAQVARSYIDLNRAEDDIDPAVLAENWPTALNPSDRSLLGLGLVRRLCKSGVPVYEKPLSPADVQKRIQTCYRPYHETLQKIIAQHMRRFGQCYLIDCHSMPGSGTECSPGKRPDFVLGDRNGTSADPAFTRRVSHILHDMGFTVALNDPYKGVEIVHRYGQPQTGQHALQLEINRRLYMNEQTLEKTPSFTKLKAELAAFFQTLASELAVESSNQEAAE